MTSPDTVIYAYGLVAPDHADTRFPAGLDDASVETLRTPHAGVLVSRLPASAYAPDRIEHSSADVSWLSPRAMAHDRVLTWAQEHGGVVPFPMFTMFRGDEALAQSLRSRAEAIGRVFRRVSGADEFGVRIHRRDEQMMAVLDTLDAGIARLRAESAAASPGQRYLLERKIADQSKNVMRSASQRIAREIFGSLRAAAREAVSRPLTPDASRSDVTLVLNAAFLVERAASEEFRARLGAHMREQEPHGLVFDFTGPWPPYNFVGEAMAAEEKVRT